jgi:hypothetical protein
MVVNNLSGDMLIALASIKQAWAPHETYPPTMDDGSIGVPTLSCKKGNRIALQA